MKWHEQARLLKCGSRRRIQHCKDDNSMLISHDLKSVSCHCFRCGFHGFIPHGVQRIADLRKRQQEFRDKMAREGLELPEDYTLDIPTLARAWYLKYGISPELADMYGIGYTPYLDRVVLPIYEDGDLVAMQLRAVDKDVKPKYLNPAASEFNSVIFESQDGEAEYGVVTEDILSTIKVGTVLPSVSILGTNMTDDRAYKISNKFQNVILWLDNDRAGIKAVRNCVSKLALMGCEVYRVQSDKDPKTYTKDKIKQLIRGATKWR